MRTFTATVFTASLALAGTTRADTTEQDLAKYHHLRSRLVNEFVHVGTARGDSQPAPERNDTHGFMKWGDGTIALGFYLGVLATELHMLLRPAAFPGADGGDAGRLERTRGELYAALYALERLDRDADASFPDPCTTTQALNGFFLRDDVPADYHTHFPGISLVMSDFIDPTLTNKEESQDQVYHVQHGLALVAALVPANEVVQGKALRAWAIELGQRIVAHFAKGDWKIRNPACMNRVVNRGGNAIGYSYGETLAAQKLTDGALVPMTDTLWMSVWDTLKQPSNPAYGDVDNLHMALAIMAVGDGYGADTAQVLATLAATQDWPLYPLLHRVLWGAQASGFCATAPMVNARARLQLDELPTGGDPACPGASGPAVHGWTSHNRYIRGKDHAYVGPMGCEGMRYHGLDYMLLHNLYALATPGTWKGGPDADPCATTPDGGATGDLGAGGDAAMASPLDAGPAADGGTGDDAGCACDVSRAPRPREAALYVIALLGALLLRRRLSR